MHKLAATLALSALVSTPAMAVILDSSVDAGNVIADYSADQLISFDLDLNNFRGATLNYAITDADLAGPIGFNAIIRNLTGLGIENLFLSLSLSTFDEIGTVTRYFGGDSLVSLLGAGDKAQIRFDSPEYVDFAIGSPLGDVGEVDWSIDSAALRAGDILSVAVGVPEPETIPMVLAGLGLIGMMARQRKQS